MEIDKNMTSVCLIDYLKILNSAVMFLVLWKYKKSYITMTVFLHRMALLKRIKIKLQTRHNS